MSLSLYCLKSDISLIVKLVDKILLLNYLNYVKLI